MSDAQDPPENVEELRTQIEQTRDELADTVSALAAKADVKGRAKDKAQETREVVSAKARQTRDQAQQLMTEKPWLAPTVGVGGLVAIILATWFALKHRKS